MRTLDDPDILRSILESIHTGVYFVGRDERIQFWNGGAERITGYLRQDVIGHFCRDFFPPQDEAETTRVCAIGGDLANVLRDGKPACADAPKSPDAPGENKSPEAKPAAASPAPPAATTAPPAKSEAK